jgi:DeoR family transcriptional regulator of aga operon
VASLDEFEREQAVLLELESTGRVVVAELAERFGVSTVTVRKTLESLQRRNALRRVRGGAVSSGVTDEGAFEVRVRHAAPAKQAIARAVAQEVDDGDAIAMDSSTSCYYLALELLDRRNLVVITNGMRTAMLFMEQSSAMVLMPGGVLRRSAGSMVGPIGDVLAGRGRVDKGFFGLMGLSVSHGLLDIAVEEAMAKQYLASACERVYGLFDSSKVGKLGLHPFVAAERVYALYTDDGIPADAAASWAAIGARVNTVPVTETGPDGERVAAIAAGDRR